jgi:hypothetical protein
MAFEAMKRTFHALFAALALIPPSAGAAERWDPTRPQSFSLTPARTSSRESASRLPENPAVVWRVRVASGVPFAPTATGDGSIVLALTTPVLAEYDARGRLVWSERIGPSGAATSPVVLGDGTRLVLTQAGEAVAFSAHGQLLRRVGLPLPALDSPPLLAAAFDGGLFIAVGRRLVRLDAALGIVANVRADQEIRAVLPNSERPLVVTANGTVFELGTSALRRVASFSSRVDAAARGGDRNLFAILEGRRLVELDVPTQTPTTRFAETDVDLLPFLAANPTAGLRVLSGLELLLAFGLDGRESFRVALPAGTAGVRTPIHEFSLDQRGTTLVARSGVDLVAVHADGSLVRVDGTACGEPLPVVGAAAGYAVYACRSGILLGLGERAPVTDTTK